MAIVVAEILGLEPKDITIQHRREPVRPIRRLRRQHDLPRHGAGAYAARPAARDDLFDKIAPQLKAKKEDLAIEPGKIVDKAASKKYAWKEACARLGMDAADRQGGGERYRTASRSLKALSNVGVGGVQVAEVLVDTETGVVRCTKVVAVQDCGLVINKQGCESQVAGGVIMGVNYALFEERIMDRHTGRQVNADMEFYKLGGIKDMPQIVVHMHDMPERGVIGIGEPPTISTQRPSATPSSTPSACACRTRRSPRSACWQRWRKRHKPVYRDSSTSTLAKLAAKRMEIPTR